MSATGLTSPMLGRLDRRVALLTIVTFLSAGLFLMPTVASATKVNDGTGRALTKRPALLMGWGYGMHEVLGGASERPPKGYNGSGSFGKIRWNKWRKNAAVGRGLLWSNSCSPSCGSGRWTISGRVKVRLFKPKKGTFTRMKFSWVGGPKNTAFFAYRSVNPPQWRMIKRLRVKPSNGASSSRGKAAKAVCHVPGYPTFRIRPRRCWVYEYGTNGQAFLSKMRWQKWSKNIAIGTGRIDYYDHPEMGGKVRVRFTRPKRQSCLPFRVFARASFRQVTGMQKGNKFSMRVLSCPHAG